MARKPTPAALDLEPHLINGKKYYDLRQFACIVGRHASHISLLFREGNKLRTLKGIRVAGKPFIEVEEVECFPFDSRRRR